MKPGADTLPDDIDALRAALLAERNARHEAEARATGAEALIAHLKLLIAKLQRDRFGPTSERSRRLLDQLELQLEELEADAAEAEAKRPELVQPAGSPDSISEGAGRAKERVLFATGAHPSSRRDGRRADSPESGIC